MASICIVDRDEKSMNEMIAFIKSSDLDLEIHKFSSLEAFTAATHLFDTAVRKQKVVTKIDVLIIDYEVCGKIEEDIKKIRRGLEIQQLQGEFPTRIILTSFEKVKIPLTSLRIDDYIFRPLEKQLFLQKLEIALAAPEKVEPSYLALQPIKERIEVGKKSTLAYINDFSLTIRNPGPLHEGAFVSFYSRRFGDQKIEKVLGRSHDSQKDKDAFLCRFDYFGLNHNKQAVIRKRYAELKEDRYTLPVTVLEKTDKPQVVIVDLDPTESQHLQQFLEENADINVLHFPSYTNFLSICFPADTKVTAPTSEAAIITKPAASAPLQVQVEINANLEMVKLVWNERKEDEEEETEVLSRVKKEWESKSDLLVKSIDPRQLESFKDVVQYVTNTGEKQSVKFVMLHSDHARSLVLLEFEKLKDTIKINFKDKTEIEKQFDYQNLGMNKITISKIDLLIIDENYILDPQLWLEGLQAKMAVLSQATPPKIIVIGKGKEPPKKFQKKEFLDYMQKPLDKPLLGKKLLASANIGIKALKSVGTKVEDIDHALVNEDIMLATEIDMLSLSEFGIAVRFGSPIRQDMLIQFYLKSFLGMEDYEPIYARCYYSEEDREVSGKYICYFTFMGVSDEVFKTIRLWMREYYIKSKEAES